MKSGGEKCIFYVSKVTEREAFTLDEDTVGQLTLHGYIISLNVLLG